MKDGKSSSKYLGALWCSDRSMWRSQIRYKGGLINIGQFKTEIDSALAYARKHIELYGKGANPSLSKLIKDNL